MNATTLMPSMMNVLIMIAAAVCAWLFGALWYGTLGKRWVEAQDTTVEEFKAKQAANPGMLSGKMPFIIALVAELIMAFVLYGIMKHVADAAALTVRNGLISGAFVWFGFILTSIAVNYAFSGRKTMLTVIDAGHWLGVTLIIGAILGAFAT